MEDMMPRIPLSGVFVCNIIALQIKLALAFSWKNVSRNITSCEHDDAQLVWEYDLNPGEYIKAKTWFTGEGKTARRIAYWKDTDGLTIEPAYRDRVTVTGKGKDSLILRRVTTSDDGIYTLLPNFPLSSEPDPRLSLNLNIYVPPLKEKGICKPDINATNEELHPFLYSGQGCGKPSPIMNWTISRNKQVRNVSLILGDNDKGGMYKVCLTGTAVATCFKGDTETLCTSYTVQQETTKLPPKTEQNVTLVAAVSTVCTVIGLAVIVVVVVAINWRRIKKYRKRNKNWRAVIETFNYENDDTILQSLILTEEVMMDKATMEISDIIYFVYNNSKELALEKINTTKIALENSEIMYIDNATDSGAGGDLMKNHQTNPSYAQCFYHTNKLLKLLVVQGKLGIGKTTWCRKLVTTWCKAHECQIIGIPTNDENIQTLKSFPLLFFMSLRNVDKGQTLTNIIKQQCLKGMDTRNDFGLNLGLLMERRPDKLIFIIHGADEAKADVDILNELVSQTKNSLTILTCRDWEHLQSKYRIQEEDYRPIAYITLKQVDTKDVTLYAKRIFDGYGYPKDAVSEFMELVRRNKLEMFMEETYFVQPLIQIWHKSGMLPSDGTDVCLCIIEDFLKEKKQLIEYTTLNLNLEVDRVVPKARGKIFVIRYGKVLCRLGKIALHGLQNKNTEDFFHEDDLVEITNTTGNQLTEICIAANLVSTAPVSDSGVGNKRLCFQHNVIKRFLIAFHLACDGESQVKDIESEECKMIQTFLTSLTSAS